MVKKRNHICDVMGCGRQRQRWQRLCGVCFDRLPRDVRTNLIRAFRAGDRPAWRHWCRRARDIIAAGDAARRRLMERPRCPGRQGPPGHPQTMNNLAATLMSRILGERPDA